MYFYDLQEVQSIAGWLSDCQMQNANTTDKQ